MMMSISWRMPVDLVDQEIDESMCEVWEMEIEKSTLVQTMVISGTDVSGPFESRGYRNIQRSRDVDRLGEQWRSDDRRKHGVHGSVRQGWLDLISAYLLKGFLKVMGGTFTHSFVRFTFLFCYHRGDFIAFGSFRVITFVLFEREATHE